MLITKEKEYSPLIYGVITFFIASIISSGVATFLYYRALMAHKEEIKEGLISTINIISNFIDVDKHRLLRKPEQTNSALYKEVVDPLVKAMASDPRIAYLYTVIKKIDGYYFVVDATPPGSDQVAVMDKYIDVNYAIYSALRSKKPVVNDDPYTDQWGTFFGAAVPFFDKQKKIEGVLAIDLEVSNYINRLKPVHFAFYLALAMGLCLSLAAGIIAARFQQRSYQFTQQLALANKQIINLNEQLKEENIHLSAELEVAKLIQEMVLPKKAEETAISNLDISGYMKPAEEVGGDYYDIIKPTGNNYSLFCIGDVTGHGLESGVIMIMVESAMQTLKEAQIDSIEKMYSILNKSLCNNIERINSSKSMTLSILQYNEKNGELLITGQHEDIVILRADNSVELIDTMDLSLPIGLEYDIEEFITSLSLTLYPNDILLLYTDGITEASNQDKILYGMDNMIDSLKEVRHQSAENIKDHMIIKLERFINNFDIYDDITLLIVKRIDNASIEYIDTQANVA